MKYIILVYGMLSSFSLLSMFSNKVNAFKSLLVLNKHIIVPAAAIHNNPPRYLHKLPTGPLPDHLFKKYFSKDAANQIAAENDQEKEFYFSCQRRLESGFNDVGFDLAEHGFSDSDDED